MRPPDSLDISIVAGLHSVRLPRIDNQALATRLKTEADKRNRAAQPVRPWGFRFHTPLLATAYLVLVTLGLRTLACVLQLHLPSPVERLTASPTHMESSLSAWWKHKLGCGRVVTMPEGVAVKVKLQDGSEIICDSGTQIAIDFHNKRSIAIYGGSITVHAEPHSDFPLQVDTPRGRIEVLGTKFRVVVQ